MVECGVGLSGCGRSLGYVQEPWAQARLRAGDERELEALLREMLHAGVRGMIPAFRFLLADETEQALIVALYDDVARLLGPDHRGFSLRQVLQRLSFEQAHPLAARWVASFLLDVEAGLHEYWGLFDYLQEAGFSDLASRVAHAAVESTGEQELRAAGREWLLELEDGIERR